MTKPERTWQLQDAKNRFSELVRAALDNEAQIITVRGHEAAVVISIEEYRAHYAERRKSLADVLLAAPRVLSDEEADELFARDQSPPRQIDLE